MILRGVVLTLLLTPSLSRAQTPQLATVPFVGCASDGQTGPVDPPKGEPKHLPIPAEIATRLAYYQGEDGGGVLGPRGWSCFETYGANGSSLFVTPQRLDGSYFFSEKREFLSGPAIQYSGIIGDTSGRFEVAKIAARVFPRFRPFVKHVMAEGLVPASNFHFGPYPTDKLTYRSDHLVEFVTPTNSEGLGTACWLAKGPGAISGFAMISGPDTDLFQLNLRLSPDFDALGRTIIEQAEREAAHPDQH